MDDVGKQIRFCEHESVGASGSCTMSIRVPTEGLGLTRFGVNGQGEDRRDVNTGVSYER